MMEQSPLRLWEEKIFTFPRFKDLHFLRMYFLLEKLGNPHLKLPPIIHVAGTNGKGSSIAFLKNILACHNYQSHVFTSPHLIVLNERFVFANQIAKDEEILSLIEEIDAVKGNMDCTWFEFLTLIAILGFSRIKADFCLIETGLGGLYDATNIIPNPLLTLITSISLDHQEHLGKNLEDIAKQKAGILKPNSIAIIGKNSKQLIDYYKKYLEEKKMKGFVFGRDWSFLPKSQGFEFCCGSDIINVTELGLQGMHQYENASLAIMATYALKTKSYDIHNDFILQGLKQTHWPGRLQKLPLKDDKCLELFVDGAHNQGGAEALLKTLFEWEKEASIHIILSLSNTKDADAFFAVFKDKKYKFYAYDNPKPYFMKSRQMIEAAKKSNLHIEKVTDIGFLLDSFKNDFIKKKILFTGSLYFIGDVMKQFIPRTFQTVEGVRFQDSQCSSI